jgi:hypothetical protein
VGGSDVLPQLDLGHLASFERLDAKQSAAVHAYRAELDATGGNERPREIVEPRDDGRRPPLRKVAPEERERRVALTLLASTLSMYSWTFHRRRRRLCHRFCSAFRMSQC